MTVVNHWGYWVDDSTPVGGVVNVNNVEYLDEEVDRGASINLTYEEGWKEYLRHKTSELVGAFWDGVTDNEPHDNPLPTEEQVEEWQEEYNCFDDGPSTYLIGGWICDEDGLYGVDLSADYSAIVSYDSMTAQIVRSKWVIRAALCSPCYPGQVDLDTPGDYLGYDFPPELYGEYRRNPSPALEWHSPALEGE